MSDQDATAPSTLAPRYSATISFGSFNQKCRLPSQRQQILIAANQQIRSTALSQIQKHLIVSIPAHRRASFCHIDHFAVRKIIGQQFPCVVGGESKFRVTKNPRKLRRGCVRDQRHAATFAPMLPEPGQAALSKQEGRHNRRRVKDHSPAHAFSRAHETAAVTSSSSIPICASRARTSSARLRCSGRRTMHSPSVLTSKYSTPPYCVTTALGRVICFLTVFLASDNLIKEIRKSYHKPHPAEGN